MNTLSKNFVLQRKSYRHKRDAKLIRRALSKAKKFLGWKLQVNLNERLKRAIDWCRKNWK